MPHSEPNPPLATTLLDTWTDAQLISIAFLDAEVSSLRARADQILGERGYSPRAVLLLRLLAGLGLWWNTIWGEELHLGLGNILFGLASNCGALGLVLCLWSKGAAVTAFGAAIVLIEMSALARRWEREQGRRSQGRQLSI